MSLAGKPGKPFKAIAAMAENRVIGAHGTIPWHIPDEFKWFKQATMGQTLVMGRKTWDSIGKPLPGRRMIVVSRQPLTIPGVTVVPSLDEIDPNRFEGDTFIAGGAEIYRQALPRIAEIYLTVVKKSVEGDVLFPEFEDQFERAETLLEHPEFTVYRYSRKS
jgi:dihydrofolate reductase